MGNPETEGSKPDGAKFVMEKSQPSKHDGWDQGLHESSLITIAGREKMKQEAADRINRRREEDRRLKDLEEESKSLDRSYGKLGALEAIKAHHNNPDKPDTFAFNQHLYDSARRDFKDKSPDGREFDQKIDSIRKNSAKIEFSKQWNSFLHGGKTIYMSPTAINAYKESLRLKIESRHLADGYEDSATGLRTSLSDKEAYSAWQERINTRFNQVNEELKGTIKF